MPRDASGLYTLVTGNPVIKGEPIVATWANPTLDDIAVALTQSLDRYGNGPMMAPLVLSGAPTDDAHAANKLYVDAKAWQEAPEDGLIYGRQNVAWTQVVSFPEAPENGLPHARQDAAWVTVNPFVDAPVDGLTYGRKNAAWASTVSFPEAPQDGQSYARNSAAWTAIPPPIDAYTKAETDARYVNVTGDTMSGALTVNAALSANSLTTSGAATIGGAVSAPSYTNTTTGGTVVDSASTMLQGFRNRIVNGGFYATNRLLPSGAANITNASGYLCDRWYGGGGLIGNTNFTYAATIDPSDYIGTPFSPEHAYIMANFVGSPGANDGIAIQTPIEQPMLRDIKLGTVDAKAMTLSFVALCKSTMGSFVMGVALRTGDRSRSLAQNVTLKPYPQRFVIPIPALTTTFNNSATAEHLNLVFTVAAGSGRFAPSAGSWVAGNYLCVAGIGNIATAASNYVRISEVQLEAGTIVTPFDRRPLEIENSLCRRYWEFLNVAGQRVTGSGFAGMVQALQFRTPKRVIPTATLYAAFDLTGASGGLSVNSGAANAAFQTSRTISHCRLWNDGALPVVGDYFEGSMAFDAELLP